MILTSNKNRHKYFVDVISKNFNLVGLITEEKNNYYEKQQEESLVIQEHFKKLKEYEVNYYFIKEYPNIDTLHLNKNKINDMLCY